MLVKLSRLLTELPGARLVGDGDAEVAAVSHDSRQVGAATLFVAVPGFNADGHDYIPKALSSGAAALIVQADCEAKWRSVLARRSPPTLVVPNSRVALAAASAVVYGRPARRLRVIGVTGTDGKTSLAHLIAHVLEFAGQRTGLLCTAESRIGRKPTPNLGRFTTPEAPVIQSLLAEMAEARCQWAVIEATSHGLDLHRLDGCEFDIAVVTNVGTDHIDFHGSSASYLAAKGKLFQMLDTAAAKGTDKTAVLNADDPSLEYLSGLSAARCLTYGQEQPADVRAGPVAPDGWGSRFALHPPYGRAQLRLSKPGHFSVSIALAAASVSLAAGIDLETTADGLSSWPGAPGRLELVDEGQPFAVVVDFAHAPESLGRVLAVLRERFRGRLIVVFGCIGERDKERRVAMGRVAAELADYTVVTDDNPYTEDRDAIIGDIARGIQMSGKREGHDFDVVPDRREAIAHVLSMASEDDVVLLAGKGHEREVHLSDGSYECDDKEVARRVLRDLAGGAAG
jgi:UDP-N-acetylmuramoyl-L-alanyl-D-glutamate--2,6-diaminopimelate ligase